MVIFLTMEVMICDKHLLSNQAVTLESWKFVAFMQLSED